MSLKIHIFVMRSVQSILKIHIFTMIEKKLVTYIFINPGFKELYQPLKQGFSFFTNSTINLNFSIFFIASKYGLQSQIQENSLKKKFHIMFNIPVNTFDKIKLVVTMKRREGKTAQQIFRRPLCGIGIWSPILESDLNTNIMVISSLSPYSRWRGEKLI